MEGWIALTRVSQLTERPKLIQFKGRPYVAYKHKNKVQFLPDTCIHRGMSLSKGQVLENGRLECPYHGWTFDSKGFCSTGSSYCGQHGLWFNYKTSVMDDLLWIQPTDLNNSVPEPPEMPKIEGRSVWFETVIEAPAQLIIENGIDPNHASWVHANPFGFGTYQQMPTHVVHQGNDITFDYVPNKSALSSKLLEIQTTENFHTVVYPYTTWSVVELPTGHRLITYVTLCPESETRTRMFVGFSHNTPIPDWILVNMGKVIVEQDRQILENVDTSYRYLGTPGINDDLIEEYRDTLHNLTFK